MQQHEEPEPAYAEFVFRVYPDGRKTRRATVYEVHPDGSIREAVGRLDGPVGAFAATAVADATDLDYRRQAR